jgi:pimeloyl-ACP methyl ester carboxylesterase
MTCVFDDSAEPIAGRTAREPVVLVHCSASSARQWKALADQPGDFQPVPLDLYGHGNRKRWDGSGPLSLSEEAAAIGETCRDGMPFHLVGHSYGGAVALRFALDHPERLRSLTLVEPSCFHILKATDGREAHLLGDILAVADTVNRGVICGDYRNGMATFIDYWSGANTWAALAEDKKTQFADLAVHVAHHFWRGDALGGLRSHRRADLDPMRHALARAVARDHSAPCRYDSARQASHDPQCRPHVADHPFGRREPRHIGTSAEQQRSR